MGTLTLVWLVLGACGGGLKWSEEDLDGDGYSWSDCDDDDPDIFPGQVETWYDGVDANCDGLDDYDADGDGFVSAAHGGDDCHDDNAEAFPGSPAEEVFYDCVDQDCDGNDGDQDGDGYVALSFTSGSSLSSYPDACPDWEQLNHDASGAPLPGGDCWDDPSINFTANYQGQGTPPTPDEVHPGADEVWYDNLDQDCDGASDFDADRDGFDQDEECDDLDPNTYPNPNVEEIWYDCQDQNCDGNDGDQDEDGYLTLTWVDGDGVEHDYTAECGDWATLNPGIAEGDCWDDPNLNELPYYPSINGFPNLSSDAVNPGATETWYDGVDQDCAGEDEDFDADGDRFDSDEFPNRDGDTGRDCQDDDAAANPGGFELCATDYDDDCDGEINEVGAIDGASYYLDADGDTYGDLNSTQRLQCGPDSATQYTTLDNTDCDDSDSGDYPGATESVANGDDEDCDGVDDCYQDSDHDGYGSSTVVTGTSLNCDRPSAGFANDANDCDDGDSGDYPGATETVANGDDEDCDGVDDCYQDSDGDGYGSSTVVTGTSLDCDQASSGFANDDDDCNDGSSAINPGATELPADNVDQNCDNNELCYVDSDRDGYGSTTTTTRNNSTNCNAASQGYANDDDDCDDGDNAINPAATEVCDSGVDNDCDGLADDDDSSVDLSTGSTFYADTDGDGFGNASVDLDACLQPSGYVADDTDCDDGDGAINPAATEACDGGIDNDCDGLVDDDDTNVSGLTTYYADDDNDGFGDPNSPGDFCVQPSTHETSNTDCDDTNDLTGQRTFPGAAPNDSATACMKDRDQDDWGDDNASRSGVSVGTDCSDTNASIYPGASDTWYDGVDSDCAGNSDYDADGDGFDSDGYSGTDCDDGDSSINTSATETWYDGVDQDCDGASDYDADADGYDSDAYSGDDCDDADNAVSPGATEIWYDGFDQDCSGGSDDDADGDGEDHEAQGGTDCHEGTALDDTVTYPNDGGLAASAINSAASDTWYDGTDQDCDGANDYDADGDGEESDDYGGDDCDDTTALASSTGDELDSSTVCFDGYDNDCDGVFENGCYDDGVNDSEELIISEIYYNDAVADTWFEIANTSGGTINLNGMVFTLYDYGTSSAVVAVTINTDEVLADGERYVLCKNATRTHLVGHCDYDWVTNDWDLVADDNLGIKIEQADDGSDVLIDEVNFLVSPFSGWPELASASTHNSIELCESSLNTTDNDSGASWAEVDDSGSTYRYYPGSGSGSFYGTPGATNSCN
ncbi:MAG: hypothetical protein H6741_06485 [Alphaproteobacteria bacterium]|nr:hypothetical protein [Alphaproteobacteria bacterium]